MKLFNDFVPHIGVNVNVHCASNTSQSSRVQREFMTQPVHRCNGNVKLGRQRIDIRQMVSVPAKLD
jgi:hypothetical protein